jgi:serine/threonine-protein kinase
MPPETLSHYNILGELGRGGMGVVYKAADTKLDRTVALKVLPPHALTSEDDRSRFYREARSAAALHHPNIATVFEIDEEDGQPFIAIEFVDGQSLHERIAAGPLPLKDAVSIAAQIAEGLKVAHAANIVHRDIKSANVMLTGEGKAKILDFGLAQTAASTKLTQMGSTLGTVAYMSPQQARGEEVDHRTDLWSLGAVLYEMIAGKPPFPGDFEQAVVYSILHDEPKPLTAIRTGVPMGLEWIVSKLLSKDPENRYQSAADLLVDLRTVDLSAPGMSRIAPNQTVPTGELPSSQSETQKESSPSWIRTVFALVLGAAIATVLWLLLPAEEMPVERSVKRFEVSLPTRGSLSGLDISPDGSRIVYADLDNTVDNVHVLDLSTGTNRTVGGSAGTIIVSVSPDNQWVLLTKDLSIHRVSLSGGEPLPVVSTSEGTPRANWGPGDWIIYEEQQAIWKASTSGRSAEPLTRKDTAAGEVDHDWPQMLPDNKTIVATIEYLSEPAEIGFWDFETGEKKGQIAFPGYRVKYLQTGHLLFVLGGATGQLVAVPFDVGSLTVTGSPIPVMTGVSTLIAATSNGGTLVTGGEQGSEIRTPNATRLVVVTFPSTVKPLDFEPETFRNFELSPDGRKLAAEITGVRTFNGGLAATGNDVSVLDLERGTRIQLTFGDSGRDPTWVNNDTVAYIDRAPIGPAKVFARAADGSGPPTELFNVNANIFDLAISPTGSHVAYVLGETNIGLTRLIVRDMHSGETVDLSGDEEANIRNPTFSPDGRYLAYQNGQFTAIRDIRGSGVPVHVDQASLARWSKDGTGLYTIGELGNVSRNGILKGSPPTVMPSVPVAFGIGRTGHFDIFPDARSGIFNPFTIDAQTGAATSSLTADTTVTVLVTVNWLETLR